jgi:hypothetical protein
MAAARSLSSRANGDGEVHMETIVNAFVWALNAALLGFIAYGGYLVLGGGRFHRDAPEDAALPHLDLSPDLDLRQR